MPTAGNFRQDMPPQGGYRKFNYERSFPKLVWRPGMVVGVAFGASVYGAFQALASKRADITEKFEDVDINNAMSPFLTAERDRTWLRLLKKNRDLEAQIMKDVPGWKVGTYYGEPVYFTLGEKWWDPTETEVFAHSWVADEHREHLWRHHSEYAGPKFYDNWLPKFIAKYCW